jgi:membrane protease YdiL (CAAX protease family)
MEMLPRSTEIPQYSLPKILLIWALAAFPMGLLGWVVAPALATDPSKPGFERLAVLTVGLIWQFGLVLYLVRKETGNLSWAVLKGRLWLGGPRSPQTGEHSRRLWWWLVPLVVVVAIYQMKLGGYVGNVWTSLFPFLAEPPGWSLGALLHTPEGRAQMEGAWGVLALFSVSAIFNTVLGEELLFRGLLLPRMNSAFGSWDWVANGILFGLYHLHQPWGMLSLSGVLFFALPTKMFQCSWFGIVAHSGQSVFFLVLMLGLVLGLA